MSKLATKLAKLVLRTLPAYPGADYRPTDQLTTEVGIRLARLAYDDESESGCGFLKYFEGQVKVSGGIILDLGCGFGGRTLAFQQVTGNTWVGVDIDSIASVAGLQFARSMGSTNAFFATAVGESLPFTNDSFDAVLCYDVLEHVQDLERTLAEVYRVLKPAGLFLTVFPPYFHPKGSHLEGYASRVPYANLIFPSKVLLRAIDELLEERGDGYRPQALRPGDRLYSLNGVTIRSFRRMLNRSNFEVLRLEFLPLLNKMIRQFHRWKMHYYAWLFYPLSRIPVLQELFTHRIVAILRKPQPTVAPR
ncbi:MAG: class I SAM-dependent methyltransferase [Acidobacteriota bacterium]